MDKMSKFKLRLQMEGENEEHKEGLIKNQIPNNLFVGKDYLCLFLELIDGSSRFVPFKCAE